jgi:hypothetical protein
VLFLDHLAVDQDPAPSVTLSPWATTLASKPGSVVLTVADQGRSENDSSCVLPCRRDN